jgi:hypothetical protein
VDFLRLIDAKLGRWLAYADSCVNAESDLPRCHAFWNFVGVMLAAICIAAVAGVALRIILERRKSLRADRRYTKPG